jgi:hypothetical protein
VRLAQVEPTFRNFVAAFRGHWFAAMSGVFSVPFYGLAVYLDNKFAQTIFLALAFSGSWFAAYTIWRSQCERANVLDAQLIRYELDVEFDPEKVPECHLPGDNGPWEQFRIKVSNRQSGKTIHRCKGTVERVESRRFNRPYVEKVPLTWAVRFDEDYLDLQDGDSYPLHVIVMFEDKGISQAEFIRRTNAHNSNPFNQVGEYQCSIVLTSDETKPKRISFTFDWTGDRSTSRIKDVKTSDQPTF